VTRRGRDTEIPSAPWSTAARGCPSRQARPPVPTVSDGASALGGAAGGVAPLGVAAEVAAKPDADLGHGCCLPCGTWPGGAARRLDRGTVTGGPSSHDGAGHISGHVNHQPEHSNPSVGISTTTINRVRAQGHVGALTRHKASFPSALSVVCQQSASKRRTVAASTLWVQGCRSRAAWSWMPRPWSQAGHTHSAALLAALAVTAPDHRSRSPPAACCGRWAAFTASGSMSRPPSRRCCWWSGTCSRRLTPTGPTCPGTTCCSRPG
jgi:hypothetical protein